LSAEESIGLTILNISATLLTAFVVFIIPALIILALIKRKGRLPSLTLKKTLGGTGLLFVGLIILGVAGSSFMSDEEKVIRETQQKMDDAREKQEQYVKEAQTLQKEKQQKYASAKYELNSYLQKVNTATSECNKVPNSIKFPRSLREQAGSVVVNAAIMILLIEETPIDSGLWSYKPKIITAVDKLSDCLNRH